MVREKTGVQADLEVGSRGQFDVVLDGEVIASRQKGLLTRLLGGGWPDEEAVAKKVAERMSASKA